MKKKLLYTFNEVDFINVFTQIKFESIKEIIDYSENIIKLSKEFHISSEIFQYKKNFFQTNTRDKEYFNQKEAEEKKQIKMIMMNINSLKILLKK